MKNPIDQIDKWPATGSGNYSLLTLRHDEWFKLLSIEIKKLENVQLKQTIGDLVNAQKTSAG